MKYRNLYPYVRNFPQFHPKQSFWRLYHITNKKKTEKRTPNIEIVYGSKIHLTALLRYDPYTIWFTLFKVYNSVIFGILIFFKYSKIYVTNFAILTISNVQLVALIAFTMFCNYHHSF